MLARTHRLPGAVHRTRVAADTRRGTRTIWIVAAVVTIAAPGAEAARLRVGPTRAVTTIEAAINGNTYGPGDTIELDAARFETAAMLKPLGSGAAGRPIVVRGAGIGRTIVSGARLSNHKALWDVEQGNAWWTFEDMTVSGMRGAQTNARGFFLVGCQDVVVQRCEVTDCWNGFMSAGDAARVTVQYCDVHHCGGLQGPAHNFYMSGGRDFVIRHNWIHDAQYGTCYKDRTQGLKLLYNRIENAAIEGYEVSLAGDGSGDQGEALLVGNIVVKSPSSSQQTHFVRFEDGRGGTLRMLYNTLVGQPRNVLVSSQAARNVFANNILYGGASVVGGAGVEGSHNWVGAGRDVGGFVASLRTASPGFLNPGAGDYRLASGSACIDAASAAAAPPPEAQWAPPHDPAPRTVLGRGPDVGALETAGGTTAVRPSTWSDVKARYR
jgi:hypothetical protein